MTEKLKPCPFCGSDNQIIENVSRTLSYRGRPFLRVQFCVNCVDCTCGALGGSIKDAIAAWNRRTND
jgi:Lar family restriction alleviation protein